MADEKKLSHRETTLISVLERLVNRIEHHDMLLDEIERHQLELSSALEHIKLNIRLDEIIVSLERLEYNIKRYRSDMLNIANEQDSIGSSVKDVAGKQAAIFSAHESIARDIADLTARYAIQEKTVREHSEHSVKQGESMLKDVSAANIHVTKLHADTEKRLTSEYEKIQRQQDELRHDVMRRMLIFDSIEAALNTLMSRTEPPPPKELPRVIRLLYRGTAFLRGKLSWLFRKVKGIFKKV